MSNLAGSYKVGVGEGHGVDLREQERRARLLMLDGNREPSPQPIFGEPVKVELEDETARRIKNTLGDVTQVLINDPKSLIGISRSAPNSVYPSNGHQVSGHPSSSHPMSGLPSNSHPMSGHPNNSHPISGHINSHSMSGNSSNSHLMSGHSSSSHSMSGHQPSSHPMSGHSSNSHLVSSHQTNTHLMSGHQSNTHPFTGYQTIAHSIAGHQSNTHPITGHPSNTHPMTGHPSSSHPITGHPSNSHLISGHTSSSHPITGHPSNSHSLTGHSTNSHLITGHPNNSHPTTGHPSNSHPIPGHTTGGLPSNGYHMTGHPVNVHPIPGHPSNGHPISGYTATGYSGAGHVNAPSRPQAASKKVPIPANNNVSKPSNPNMPNMFPKVAPDKRNSYNRQKPDSPVTSKPFHTSSFNSVESTQHQVMPPHYQAQDNRAWNTDQKKSSNVPFSVNLNFSGGTYNNVTIGDINVHSGTTSAPIWSCGPETPAIQVTPFHLPPCVTPSTANKPVYNIPGIAPNMQQKFDIAANNTSPVKRPVNRPSHLKIERKPTSPIGVETILKEMTKPVPAPLTAIQTPRTEETGFAFPPEPKEEPMVVKVDEKANPSNIPQDAKSSYICQSSPAIAKSVSPFPNLQSQSQLQTGLVTVKIEKPEPMVTDYTSSLQDDLEMSESDEEAVPEKKEDASEYLSVPSNPVTINNTPPSVPVSNTNMETNSASSSSSESGDSDSDDDSSESNNSDSSSESSDEDTSSMKWGLSNFVDESRRNHSPAFRSLEMQKQLNNVKPVSSVCPLTAKDNFSPPVSQPLSGFIVADTPVTAKSEILSPIRSPAHPVVGPRTPPSPTSPLKDLSEGDKNSISINDSKSEPSVEPKSSDSVLDISNENKTPLSSTPISCDENKENTIANTTSDNLSSEMGSSPLNHSSTDDKIESKDTSKSSSEKDTSFSEAKSSPLSSDAPESSNENYSIKTRQKGATSAKKNKSSNLKKVANNNQNDETNSPPIAKFKHPRACRKSTEKLVAPPSPAKTEQVKEPIKKRSKPAIKQKEVPSPEKNKTVLKPTSSPKKPTKASVKQKTKAAKVTSKTTIDVKKVDLKNKKKKFVVENFLQSPTSNNDLSSIRSPSPVLEDLPVLESKKHQDSIDKPTNSSASTGKNSVKNNSKTSKTKAGEKLRRSARCSERASSLSLSEPPTTPKQSAEHSSSVPLMEISTLKSSSTTNKKPQKKIVKSKSHVENLPISIDPPLQILSPIPHESPPTASTSELGNPKKIMVCIPLSKLLRIPNILHQIQEPDSRLSSKNHSLSSVEDIKQKKDPPSEKSLKNISNKCSQSKDFKDKPRTVQASKNCKKNVSNTKKDNTSKPVSESASKNASSVNKSSAKLSDKVICDVENKLPKKRKSEEDSKQMLKKKPKLSSRSTEERKSKEQISGSKAESAASQNDGGGKSKPLERCDSASSLNSLCSQRSSKSSKDKKDSVMHDSKRLKTSASSATPIKEIKQEKEDRSKVHIKKEPILSLDKCMKSRDKSAIADIDCKEKGDAWSENLNSSSQYCHWDDLCKEDSKAPLESILDSTMNWDHLSFDMHKELKESSGLKMLTDQGPIMPMDYYWTEGRKMKKMAEMEVNNKDMYFLFKKLEQIFPDTSYSERKLNV